jgi:hypothetical protein
VVKAPQVLKIQLNRLGWSAEANTYQKTETKVHFDRVIFMDRYLEVNREATEERRLEVNCWREELVRLTAKLASLQSHGPDGVDLQAAFSSVLHFFEADSSTVSLGVSSSFSSSSSSPSPAPAAVPSPSTSSSLSAAVVVRPCVPASPELLRLLQRNLDLVAHKMAGA